MRRKFVLVFSGVLAKDCRLTEGQLKFRRECIRIMLYPTEKYFWEDFNTFCAAVHYWATDKFLQKLPLWCSLWMKCLLHQPFSVWESCICSIWDKLLCIFDWSLNQVAFGSFPLCWKFKWSYHPYLNCLGIAFWFRVVNLELLVLVLFGFVGCCWFFQWMGEVLCEGEICWEGRHLATCWE